MVLAGICWLMFDVEGFVFKLGSLLILVEGWNFDFSRLVLTSVCVFDFLEVRL